MNTTVHPAEAINPQAAVSELKSTGASFTPGPWVSVAKVSNNRGWSPESQRVQIWSADGETLIADYRTDYAEYPETYACNEANARLIAEVPELLSALQGLLHRHNDGSDERFWAEWDTATEAIAKATGVQQ